jgi:hypothetical protein
LHHRPVTTISQDRYLREAVDERQVRRATFARPASHFMSGPY